MLHRQDIEPVGDCSDSVPRSLRVLEVLIPGGPWIVAAVDGPGITFGRTRVTLRCSRSITIIDNRTVAVINGLTTCAVIRHTRITIGDGTLVGNTAIVSCVVLTGNWTTVTGVTLTGNWTTVTGNCSGSRLPVAVRIQIGIELIGVLEPTFLFESPLLSQAIPLGGVAVELLRLGGSAFRLSCLNICVGLGLLSLSLPLFSVSFPSMYFVLGLGGFLTNPCGLLALVFALLGCSLPADRDDDADDNQNNDDRYDYPDDGSCIHALSPCCLFGSH